MQIKPQTTVGIFVIFSICAFFYMTFQIGVFHFDKLKYASYLACFRDVSGLTKKADVKIAGVKVGWVDSVKIIEDGNWVQVKLMVTKDCILAKDTTALVRQEGILGLKYVELIPGDTSLGVISYGSTLSNAKNQPVSFDELVSSIKKTAITLDKAGNTFNEVLSANDKTIDLNKSIESFNKAANSIIKLTESLSKLVLNNEKNIDQLVLSVMQLSNELKAVLPKLANQVHEEFLPKVTENTQNLVSKITQTADSFNDTLSKVNIITQKINENVQVFDDLKNTASSAKVCFEKIRNVTFALDGHTEYLHNINKSGDNKNHNLKSYVNLQVWPCRDYYFIGGLSYNNNGYISKKNLTLTSNHFNDLKACETKKNLLGFNLQFGALYKTIGGRFGFFESTPGIAFDCWIPFSSKKPEYGILSSLELYDFTGKNNLYGHKPHLKWLNRLFFTPYSYIAFGADDVINKSNASAFIGAGLYFW